jgi:hypothetical protein
MRARCSIVTGLRSHADRRLGERSALIILSLTVMLSSDVATGTATIEPATRAGPRDPARLTRRSLSRADAFKTRLSQYSSASRAGPAPSHTTCARSPLSQHNPPDPAKSLALHDRPEGSAGLSWPSPVTRGA